MNSVVLRQQGGEDEEEMILSGFGHITNDRFLILHRGERYLLVEILGEFADGPSARAARLGFEIELVRKDRTKTLIRKGVDV